MNVTHNHFSKSHLLNSGNTENWTTISLEMAQEHGKKTWPYSVLGYHFANLQNKLIQKSLNNLFIRISFFNFKFHVLDCLLSILCYSDCMNANSKKHFIHVFSSFFFFVFCSRFVGVQTNNELTKRNKTWRYQTNKVTTKLTRK